MDTSNQTDTLAVPESPVVTTARRRHWSAEEKRKIVEKTLMKGASVARVARAHGVNANQVFQWRRLYGKGRLGNRAMKLLPARVADTAAGKRSVRHWSTETKQSIVEATLAKGASVRQIAEAHGVHPSLVYDWRKKYRGKQRARKVRTVSLLPVSVKEGVAGQNETTNLPARAIEIELPKGRMRIMGADAALLRAALELLR
jgi:transposase-like protein